MIKKILEATAAAYILKNYLERDFQETITENIYNAVLNFGYAILEVLFVDI